MFKLFRAPQGPVPEGAPQRLIVARARPLDIYCPYCNYLMRRVDLPRGQESQFECVTNNCQIAGKRYTQAAHMTTLEEV